MAHECNAFLEVVPSFQEHMLDLLEDPIQSSVFKDVRCSLVTVSKAKWFIIWC